MLKRIEVKNVHSIEKCEIDFIKGNYKFGDENVLGELVNPVVIYGHNGSGKSSFLNAMQHFIVLMTAPVESSLPFVVNNFLFEKYYKEERKNPCYIQGSIKIVFSINNNEYEYFLETSRENLVTKEYLLINDTCYFDRNGSKYSYKEKEETIRGISPVVPLLRILASNEISDSDIQVVYSYLTSFVHVNVALISNGAGFVTSKVFNNVNSFDLLVRKSSEVKETLKNYKTFPVYSVVKNNKLAPNGLVTPQYDVIIEDNDFKGTLPVNMMSLGMRNQSLLLSVLLSMPDNSVLFIDEGDIAIHPNTMKSFLDVIRRKKIQVVLSLHNTNAMQVLRPDQVYFAKWSKGFSNYYRLSKIYPNIREVNNIEKMYLSSIFDGAMEENE